MIAFLLLLFQRVIWTDQHMNNTPGGQLLYRTDLDSVHSPKKIFLFHTPAPNSHPGIFNLHQPSTGIFA